MSTYRGLALVLVLVAACGRHARPASAPAPLPRPELGAWSVCTPAAGVALDAENVEALKAIDERVHAPVASMYDVIIVPGFTPLDAKEPSAVVHPTAAARLDAAMGFWRGGAAPLLLVSGANVHPDGTPYVEAMLMKRYLLDHAVPPAAIVVEPCARHSHTNLRDAGRFMLRYGLGKALIVTSRDQAFYFANPRLSGFEERCLVDLGYRVGTFQSLPQSTVEFRPSLDVFRRGSDPLDP